MNKFTQGKWKIERGGVTQKPTFILASVDGYMHELASLSCDCNGNHEANAQLMVTAPKMLEALKELADYAKEINALQHSGTKIRDDVWEDLCQATNKAYETIKEATGEQS